eukprot:TRINITY_DN7478_c0_g1_i1.p1 TRINITY_DN7478_c0_g1~~TRINITY_DN7478_c0_g1_i1.p1  ORF type:complete len:326 (+),score=99.59 TRINITY_DN7478_c0_g1_i1:123-1100(+)
MPFHFQPTEKILDLYDGQRIAIRSWGARNEDATVRILGLHGWLDNGATFDTLVPLLLASNNKIRFVAMDFIGHGKSSHKSASTSYLMVERVLEVVAVADLLHWDSFVLMGHSMGAAIATIVAGTVPDRVQSLIILDGFPGPYAFPPRISPPERLEKALKEKPRLINRQRRVYPSYQALFERYMQQNSRNLSPESATILLKGGIEEVDVTDVEKGSGDKGFCFRHDPKLTGTVIMYMTEEQVISFLDRIACPVLLIIAKAGLWRFSRDPAGGKADMENRMRHLKNHEVFLVEGRHHVHLDSPERVHGKILSFLDAGFPGSTPVAKL